MHLEWYAFDMPAKAGMQPAWELRLVGKGLNGHPRTVRVLGYLLQPDAGGWVIFERAPGLVGPHPVYSLDNDLTLDDAQRAAKLFLCVGKQ